MNAPLARSALRTAALTIGGALALALTIPVAEAPAVQKFQKYNVSAYYLHQETFTWKGSVDSGPPCNVRRTWDNRGFFQEDWDRARVRAVVRYEPGEKPELGIGPGVKPGGGGGDENHIRTTYTVTATGDGEIVVKRPRSAPEECTHETIPESRSKPVTAGCGQFKGKGKLVVSRNLEGDSLNIGLLEPAKEWWDGYPGGFAPFRGDPEGSYCPGHRRAERGLPEKYMFATMPAREMAAKPRPWSKARYQTYTIMGGSYANPDAALYPVKVEAAWLVSFVPVNASKRNCKTAIRQLRAENRQIGILRDLTQKQADAAVLECVQGGGLEEVWDTADGWADEP